MGRWPKGIGVYLAGRNPPPGMAKRSEVPIYRNVGVGVGVPARKHIHLPIVLPWPVRICGHTFPRLRFANLGLRIFDPFRVALCAKGFCIDGAGRIVEAHGRASE